jgi:polysaccharide biosynthesis protein PslA
MPSELPYSQPMTTEGSEAPPSLSAAHHDHHDHPVLPSVIRWIDGLIVVSATLVTASVGRGLLTRQQGIALVVADIVAVLVFFLTSRRQRLPILPYARMVLQQMRLLAPSVLVSGCALAGVLWWLGWSEQATLRAAGVWVGAVAVGLIAVRSMTTVTVNSPLIESRLTRKIAIIGYDAHAFKIAERYQSESKKAVTVVGVFDDGARLPGQTPVQGSISDLIQLSRETNLHGIIIALPPAVGHEKQIARMSWRLRSVLADIYVMPYLMHGPDVLLPMQALGPMSFMVLQRRPLDEWQTIRKKFADITIGLLASLLLFPLLLLIALLIVLDSPGPVLFRQPRLGFNNRQFTVFKFRSMYTSATDLMSVRQTSRGDPRVTRVGKWIRRLSLDELPQLLNVLRGEMSLVGPRPHAPQTRVEDALLNDVTAEYVMRHQVKPGITGWAQVNGSRGELVTRDDLRRRVAYDLEYIQRWSIRFDLKIMVLTVLREIMSKHAF